MSDCHVIFRMSLPSFPFVFYWPPEMSFEVLETVREEGGRDGSNEISSRFIDQQSGWEHGAERTPAPLGLGSS